MMFALAITVADTNRVYAADDATYFGSTLAATSMGSAEVKTSLADGLQIEFKKASDESAINYKNTLYVANLSVKLNYTGTNFEESWFCLTDADNDTKWVKVYFKAQDGVVAYKLEDNFSNKTDYKTTSISADKLTQGVVFSYDAASQKFKIDGVVLSASGIETVSFYKNMANLSTGISGISGDDESLSLTISEINGQSLKTTDDKISSKQSPVIISKAVDQNTPVVSETQTVNAAAEKEYIFPYYCLDVLGTGWFVSVDDGVKTAGRTKYTMGAEGQNVVIKLFAQKTDTTPVVTLNINSVKDTRKVVISDMNGLLNCIKGQGEVKEALEVGHLVAPSEGNTFEFPHLTASDYANYIAYDPQGIDTFDSVKVKVGYKAPGATGGYTFATSYAVRINKTGNWSFVYQFVDGAGNTTVSDPFELRVVDEHAPTIKVEDRVEISVDAEYQVPSATITDNASGIDTRYTKWTLYEVDADGNRTEVTNYKYGEEGYDEAQLKDGKLTPTEVGKKYVVVYEARDNFGNVAENKEMEIEVVEATPVYTPNPFNEFVKTALIVVACLAGLGLIILFFVKPKQRTLK